MALLNALADCQYCWGVAKDETEALKLSKAIVSKVLAENCSRASQGSHPLTYLVS